MTIEDSSRRAFSPDSSITSTRVNNASVLENLPVGVLNLIIWKMGSGGRTNFRFVNQSLRQHTNKFFVFIHDIFRMKIYGEPLNHQKIEEFLNSASYQPQNFMPLELAKFFASKAANVPRTRFGANTKTVANNMCIDFYIEAGIKGSIEARLWLQAKSEALSKIDTMSLMDDSDSFNKAKIHCALGDLYLKDNAYQLLAPKNYQQAWTYVQDLAETGDSRAISYFYDHTMGENSSEKNKTFFNKLLDDHLANLSDSNNKAKQENSCKWILSIYEESQLPEYYKEKQEKALLGVVQSMDFSKAWNLGRYGDKELNSVRSAIGNILRIKLKIPNSVEFRFYACSLDHDHFIIYTEKADKEWEANLKKIELFSQNLPYYMRDYEEYYCLLISQASFDKFKEILTKNAFV